MIRSIASMRGGGALLCAFFLTAGAALAAPPASAASPTAAPAALQFDAVRHDPEQIKGLLPKRASALVSPVPGLAYAKGMAYAGEVEPNGTSATASPLAGRSGVVRGNLYPNGDVDLHSFTANAGDRVHAAVMTAASAGNSTDSQLRLLASDGTTIIEFDDDDGSLAALSSSIAGATLPTAGTYFLQVNDFTVGTTSQRAYELHYSLQSGTPTPEVEPNDAPALATALPANGWVSGARNPALATEQDWYSLSLNAGDTVFLSLDLDPERDGTSWNGRLGFGLFGDSANQILVVDDSGGGDVAPNPVVPSEAFFFTAKTAGTYYAFVDSASAAVGGPTATYHLNVTVHPAANEGVNCTVYTSTDVPLTLGPGTGLTSSTITVPGNPRIADIDVSIQLNHALMQDLDVHLRSPAGNDNGLFTDIGANATGGQAQMDATFDDEAGSTPTFTVLRNVQVKPENNSTAGTASTSGAYRLSWFDGENAGGTWTLDIRDDTAGGNGGTLTGWSMRICEMPPPPACAAGFAPVTVYATDFESGAAGFTHSGTQDEWELGLPATASTATANPVAAFATCNSGANCWKTDLDNTYNASSNQDLLSPNINLAGLQPPVVVNWAQRHQIETANFDHMFVDAQQVGGATPVRLYEWLDPTPISASTGTGNPQANIGGSVGWALMSRRADSLAGLNTELRFHLDSDTSVQFGGLAIDDVSVTACRALSADLSITKTDGTAFATPGGSTTYTITASNAGPDPVTAAAVADTFPAIQTCTWTCVGAGGGTCTAAGSGNIDDSVDLPALGSVTYTATCAVSAAATGSMSNTATVSSSIADPDGGNNSATDVDTLVAQADLAIAKTDGVDTATPGGSVTYTITASNPGPSNAPGATVADVFPAALACEPWTCVGTGGGTCTASGSGDIADTVNLPAGGSVIYTASCDVAPSATGVLENSASVAAPAGVTDPEDGNNLAVDADTLAPSADLSITKTDGVASVVPGTGVTYTITAANAGPSDTTGTVTDTLPAGLACSWTCAGNGGGTCSAAGSGNIGDAVVLPAGGSVVYTATCTVAADATGTLVNSATITGAASDPDGGNNTASDENAVVATADLSITKTDGTDSYVPGGALTYTITASNAGPSTAAGATVADTFPAGLTCTWACAGSGGGTCGAASGSGNIAETVDLPSGGAVVYTAQCTVAADQSGTLTNIATVAAPAGIDDPQDANNSASDTDSDDPQADLSISKTDGTATAAPGDTLTYTIVATNAGPSGVTGATVGDTLPADLTCTWTCAGSGGGICAASGSGDIADSVTLPVAGSVTYTASCDVAADATGTIGNTATVAPPATVTELDTGNNSATDTTELTQSADVSITKSDGVDNIAPGATLTYVIVASNAGPQTAEGVVVTDTFPAGCSGVAYTATGTGGASGFASGTGNIADGGITLPAGASVTYTATCTVADDASDGTVVTNTATVGTTTAGDDAANNSASDSTTVQGAAAVSGTKTVAGTFAAGGTVTYTIVLDNAGNAAQGDNPGDEFTDVLPAGLAYVSATATSGTTSFAAGTVRWNGTLAAGASVTITIVATIDADATGTISNQGTVNYDADNDGSNDTTAPTDDPAEAGTGNPTAFEVDEGTVEPPAPATPAVIPSSSLLSLFALAVLMLGIGWRRRLG